MAIDYKVKYDRNYDNFYPEGSTLLGGDFIVWADPSDPTSNPINFPKDANCKHRQTCIGGMLQGVPPS